MDKRKRKFILKSLILGVILSSIPQVSYSGTLSEDTRYETFEGNHIKIDEILEEDKVDVEVGGNTLVNLADNSKLSARYKGELLGGTRFRLRKIDGEGTTDVYYNQSMPYKANTVYTLVYRVVSSWGNPTSIFCNYNAPGGGFELNGEGLKNGVHTKTFSHTDVSNSLSFQMWHLNSNEANAEVVIEDVMILEGDWSNKELPDYFDGTKSFGQVENNSIEVRSTNKNLFDTNRLYTQEFTGDRTTLDYTVSGDSIFMSKKTGNGNFAGVKIKCKKGQTYTAGFIGGESASGESYAMYIYSDGLWGTLITNLNNRSNQNSAHVTFTAPGNEMYVGIYVGSTMGIGEVIEYKNVYVHEGTDTEYERYRESSATVKVSEPLRSLPNGLKDRIVKRNGQWMIERNLKEITFSSSSGWNVPAANSGGKTRFDYNTSDMQYMGTNFNDLNLLLANRILVKSFGDVYSNGSEGITAYSKMFVIALNGVDTLSALDNYLKNNPITVVYPLETPVYESLNVPASVDLFKYISYIKNNSTIPGNMKVIVDRVANRAKEYGEIAKANPTVENISAARMWANLMKDSILKDEIQNGIDSISNVKDFELGIEKKESSVNADLYIKPRNVLSMSLSTNSVTFEDYSNVDNMEMPNAININVQSSLPYDLNVYMPSQIYNSDKTSTLKISTLNIKESTESTYQAFTNTTDKLVLKNNCSEGKNKNHSIDLKLNSSSTSKADVYKTVLKFEVEQK